MTGKAPQPFTPTPVFNIVVVLTGQSLVIEKQHLGGEGGGRIFKPVLKIRDSSSAKTELTTLSKVDIKYMPLSQGFFATCHIRKYFFLKIFRNY